MRESHEDIPHLIAWLKVLSNGYVKPDVFKGGDASNNTTGVVRDTKSFMPYINGVNKKLSELLNTEDYD